MGVRCGPASAGSFRVNYSRQLQADHCRGEPAWKGVWRDRSGNSWYVEPCGQHAPKVTSKASEGFCGVPHTESSLSQAPYFQ
jgi:hypothetical protein